MSSEGQKLDSRFKILIDNGIVSHHRAMFVIVGDKGRNKVATLHGLMTSSTGRAGGPAGSRVLWVYKQETELNNQRRLEKQLKKKKKSSGEPEAAERDGFTEFLRENEFEHCLYRDTQLVLGQTYSMCVLQDFEALTPNLLARTVETVEGGGLVIILLRSMTSLRQLHTMTMDVHARYRTESHQHVVGRFNERFLLSLARCKSCLVIDDKLNILPISDRKLKAISPKSQEGSLSAEQEELKRLKRDLMEERETLLVGSVVSLCVTLDQARAVLKFVEGIVDQSLRSTVVMTAARGRGKSAALGLGMACAVAYGYSNIYVTAPSPENLKTMFAFIAAGFQALKYEEADYNMVESENPEFNRAFIRVNVYRGGHRQTIQYIHPSDAHKLGQAELVCIDEAAAIPLPLVKALLGPYLVFMSSTINGYEGTGRSLSLKLISSLREKAGSSSSDSGGSEVSVKKLAEAIKKPRIPTMLGGRLLHELSLVESIRYRSDDPVERWLTALLCLDVTDVTRSSYACVAPSRCELMHVNRDTLFSHHDVAEMFLKRLVSIYTASHYKNSPDDLQLLADAPAHQIFCLVGPGSRATLDPKGLRGQESGSGSGEESDATAELPNVYCVIQVCMEGQISEATMRAGLRQSMRAAGDLIPWTVSEQFQDESFGKLSGVRIVRIATHPDMQKMGYGKRAMELLQMYYENKIPCMKEIIKPVSEIQTTDCTGPLLTERIRLRASLPPLFQPVGDRAPESLDYIGVSYGLTADLLRFWKNVGMTPVYLRQTVNDLTGENTCIMLKWMRKDDGTHDSDNESKWLLRYWRDFRRRFVSLLSCDCFRSYRPQLALELLHRRGAREPVQELSPAELSTFLTPYDLQRLAQYSTNMADYHLVLDLVPRLARLYFLQRLDLSPKAVQSALLLGLGLQHKTVEVLRSELVDSLSTTDLTVGQMLGLFNQLMRAAVKVLKDIQMKAAEAEMFPPRVVVMESTLLPMEQELTEAAREVVIRQKQAADLLKGRDLSQYAIKGSEGEWTASLKAGAPGIVSIRGSEKKRKLLERVKEEGDKDFRKNKNKKKFKKGDGSASRKKSRMN